MAEVISGDDPRSAHWTVPRKVIATTELSAQGHATLPDPGYQFLAGNDVLTTTDSARDFADFAARWEELPADLYLTDGQPFRFRRHAQVVFDADTDELTILPPADYLQTAADNPLFGGVRRRFAPFEWTAATRRLLASLVQISVTQVLRLPGRTLINLHQVRIVGGPDHAGTPVPEGRHRDGFDFISIHLIGRDVDGGGETTLFSGDGLSSTMTLAEPMDAVYVDDRRLSHDTTPIVGNGRAVRRDVLLMSFEQSAAKGYSPAASRRRHPVPCSLS